MSDQFPDEELLLLQILPFIQRLVNISDAHKIYGLTKSQLIVMIALCFREEMTMSEVAQYMASSKEQATRAVSGICENGLIERVEHPENRTHVYIRFTDAGKSFMVELVQHFRSKVSSRLKKSLSPEEIDQLRQTVKTSVMLLSKVK